MASQIIRQIKAQDGTQKVLKNRNGEQEEKKVRAMHKVRKKPIKRKQWEWWTKKKKKGGTSKLVASDVQTILIVSENMPK